MSEHRSFAPSDFPLRGMRGFLVAYVILSGICVLVGLTVQGLPPFWGGLLCGVGIGFLGAVMLLHGGKRDITKLPEPSGSVQTMCNAPDCKFPSRSFAEAAKAYCDETGATLSEATRVLKAYVAKRESQQ